MKNEKLVGLDALIASLQIIRKYGNPAYPTHCEHDVLTVCHIDVAGISQEDIDLLKDLGFFVADDDGEKVLKSYRFGSA